MAVIGGVGTEIRHYPDGTPWTGWDAGIPGSFTARAVRLALAGFAGLELQAERWQSSAKVSYELADAASLRAPISPENSKIPIGYRFQDLRS